KLSGHAARPSRITSSHHQTVFKPPFMTASVPPLAFMIVNCGTRWLPESETFGSSRGGGSALGTACHQPSSLGGNGKLNSSINVPHPSLWIQWIRRTNAVVTKKSPANYCGHRGCSVLEMIASRPSLQIKEEGLQSGDGFTGNDLPPYSVCRRYTIVQPIWRPLTNGGRNVKIHQRRYSRRRVCRGADVAIGHEPAAR